MFTMLESGTSEKLTNLVDFTLRTFPVHMSLDTCDGDADQEGMSEWA